MRQCPRRRAFGKAASSTTTATAERKLATCQPVKLDALMAAPPVEKSRPAATRSNRLRTGDSKRSRGRGKWVRGRGDKWFREPGTDRTASEFPAKGDGNPWQS